MDKTNTNTNTNSSSNSNTNSNFKPNYTNPNFKPNTSTINTNHSLAHFQFHFLNSNPNPKLTSNPTKSLQRYV